MTMARATNMVAILFATFTESESVHAYCISQSLPIPPWSLATFSRRSIFRTAGAAVLSSVTSTLRPSPGGAVMVGSPTVTTWPGPQYLVPIIEMESSLDILASVLDKSNGAEGIRAASLLIDNFFKRGLLSNKNLYKGMCIMYSNEVKYKFPDTSNARKDQDRIRTEIELIRAGMVSYLDYCDATISAMDAMRKPLKQLIKGGYTEASADVLALLDKARAGVTLFLSHVPKQDVDRVREWIRAVTDADTDGSGVLEENEYASLSAEDRMLYDLTKDLLG